MSILGSWLWGSNQLNEAIDKATSDLLPSGTEDIALNLEICDQIRSKSVQAKDAMRALKRRLNHKNPNVQLLALNLTDICIKNGGDLFLVEIASREFMDNLISILKIPVQNIDVKNKILTLVQNWSATFDNKPDLIYVGQVYKTLKNEGFKFPPKDPAAHSAMVDTQTAPEWIDSDVCLRCRTAFSFTNRKHHCRNCGGVFDQACSSKLLPLPHFGINQEVRVCDSCHPKLTRKADKLNKGHRHSTSLPSAQYRSSQDLDKQLQRAIQLSLEEAKRDSKTAPTGDDDSDLKAAIEASLRETNAQKTTAPIESPHEENLPSNGAPSYAQSHPPGGATRILPNIPNFDLDAVEADVIMTFNQTVEQVHAQGERDNGRYHGVTNLYERANSLRPKLAASLNDAGRKADFLSKMHHELSQAVKLYDQILSEQVAPSWRSRQEITSPPISYHVETPPFPQHVQSYIPFREVQSMVTQQPTVAPTSMQPSELSPSVKLYDEILSKQVAPRWRSQQDMSTPPMLYHAEAPLFPQHVASPPPSRDAQSMVTPTAPPSSTPHSELSQPAKLYDQIFSDQVTPRWQSSTPPIPYHAETPLFPQHVPSHPAVREAQSIVSQQPTGPPPSSTQIYSSSSAPPASYQPVPSPHLEWHRSVAYNTAQTPTNLVRSNTFASTQRQAKAQRVNAGVSQPLPLPEFPSVPTSIPLSNVAQTPPRHDERKEAPLIDL